ncbi:hypothetical protein E3N88_08819 [Mikania micrantha]|uniref:Uncharacterized protein n=1 Tax=Mikania micrantha TaxID=192012 RepID=A0A5N6PJL3_9ASTR|nr:hypothetical protein E3N88_08819 [Mikania micrantha]
MNNRTNRHDREEDEEPDGPWKTMRQRVDGLKQGYFNHSAVGTLILYDTTNVRSLRFPNPHWLTAHESPITQKSESLIAQCTLPSADCKFVNWDCRIGMLLAVSFLAPADLSAHIFHVGLLIVGKVKHINTLRLCQE